MAGKRVNKRRLPEDDYEDADDLDDAIHIDNLPDNENGLNGMLVKVR